MERVRCAIAGGGPAGVMLGFLLARAGIDVAILEKHKDFFRDFRGDTVHPSTMTVLDELDLLDAFLRVKHNVVRRIGGKIGSDWVTLANLDHVPAKTKYIALMPQWDFLNFLAEQGRRYPGFQLMMETEATGLLRDGERVAGVQAQRGGETIEIPADLVVAADGRHSTLRDAAGLQPIDLGAPMDVLWFRLSRKGGDPQSVLGYVGAGTILVTLDRDTYWQCGYIIPKGGYEATKARGLEAFQAEIVSLVPEFAKRVIEIASWDDVRELEVTVNRLPTWYEPGLLFIGDAAHAMSPVGGVGINLAIQDAVAAANILTPALRGNDPIPDALLAAVQRRREPPTRKTQWLQVAIGRSVIANVLRSRKTPKRAPLILRIINAVPLLQRIPAQIVAIGFLPEHVSSPVQTVTSVRK
jgi:2-polyprenyl-6-methoxyphenol hydroxylase-like FAD-dependent oxidoreductase